MMRRNYKSIIYAVLALSCIVYADTPPPGTVKAKMYSGDGSTGVGVTGGGSMNVNVTNTSGLTTVNQGSAGATAWPVDASGHTVPVSGTFWQTTQPVSAASLPLPSGAATSAKQPALGVAGTPSSDVLTVQGKLGMTSLLVDGSGVTQPVSGTFWQATQPVSQSGSWTVLQGGSPWAVSQSGTWNITNISGTVSLPTGASTSAKQPALGTAGTASSDVITVQGIASMTALKVDGSAVTQPVSGTFWQATQPVSQSGSWTVLQGGSPWAVSQSGTWNITNISGTVSLPTGAATSAKQPALGTAGSASSDVITVQGVASMTALKVDGSAVTQPVSGTVTANAGTGTFTVDGSGHTQPVSIATAPVLVAGSAIIGKVGIDQTTPGTTNGVQVNAALPAGSNVIGHVIADSGSTTAVTSLPSIPAGSAVIGHVIADSGSTTAVTALPATPAGSNLIGKVNLATPTAVTVKAAAVTVGTSAVRLTNDGLAPAVTRVLLIAQLLSTSTANCFLGPSSVTSSGATRGIQMFAGQSFSFNNDAGDYYAICDASSQTFYITEQE